ncbi:acyltransferase family protein [Desulfovibrio sp. TomC]|uniref:acyltransferase family protein n=1 Tax=Desulfovibrio sp. TomC TaxID=1562888 RepID=UPI0005759E9C|nr:acyltransferase family protein [Desulfovibrio sp. TomC]KHK02581.1 Glycosyltransferase [Desulfovibrio sp. TomC]
MPQHHDPSITIARGLGIILVVLGHCYDPFSWYPIYSYHMAFFFVLSGFVFNPAHRAEARGYALRRARRLLAPYFLYNLLFAGLTWALAAGGGLWTDVAPFSLRALVYEPLTTGHQFPLYNGAWFLVTLFFVQLAALPLPRLLGGDSPARMLGATGLFALACVLTAQAFDLSPVATQIGKVGFGLFFYVCGSAARSWPGFEAVFTARGLGASVLCAVLLTCLGATVDYNLSAMSFHGNALLVFFTALNGSYLVLFLARHLAQSAKPASLLILLGENTVPIMCLHLLFFFLLNLGLIPASGSDPALLGNTLYCVNAPRLFPLYLAAGLFGPIGLTRAASALQAAVVRRLAGR